MPANRAAKASAPAAHVDHGTHRCRIDVAITHSSAMTATALTAWYGGVDVSTRSKLARPACTAHAAARP